MNLEKRIIKFEKAKEKVNRKIDHDKKLHVIIVRNGDDEVYYKTGKLPFCYDGISFPGSDATPEHLLKMYNNCKMNMGDEKVSMDVALKNVTRNINYWRFYKKYSF